ncbi:DegT/DnrJ/EryC1/StrS family aminotransferase [Thalassomonas sp. RHCl1]|uniref:DegT/DnrJ/EryC1/StrS family aminotransferase n=1 Tax=Thalassomonas sp. RHCl1 TaxID=2995320 RepID=UPI00248B42F9|nr:DegT/DnrJ/EryC1/StrS family aminotransferase [Thalassomonas sp. RHCl1]
MLNSTNMREINFAYVAKQKNILAEKIKKRIEKVYAHCKFIMGPEVEELEAKLGEYTGANYVISCGNGTDALTISLKALGCTVGDAVFCPAFTFSASAEAIVQTGATPIFVDVCRDTFNICPDSLIETYKVIEKQKLNPVGVLVVDLFGMPANYEKISKLSEQLGLWILGDSAQSFGSLYKGKSTNYYTSLTTTSFFPSKPLGAYGDGGAIFTNDEHLASLCRSLRAHGTITVKYHSEFVGFNSRLDTIQAAILLEKLSVFPYENIKRQKIAMAYNARLSAVVQVPVLDETCISSWGQYTIKVGDSSVRKKLQGHLLKLGIPSVVYYPKCIHEQKAYCDFPISPSGLKNSVQLSKEVLSLPCHSYLTDKDVAFIIEGILSFFDYR